MADRGGHGFLRSHQVVRSPEHRQPARGPVAGTTQNATCAAKVGVETINFAFLTLNGKATGPANPLRCDAAGTFTPDPKRDLFMISGDNLAVTVHDTPAGLQTIIKDKTSGQTGSMTASKANGFAHIQYDPTGTSCNAIPYAFHPMYSTSSEKTILPWGPTRTTSRSSMRSVTRSSATARSPIPASQFGLDSSGNPITCPAGDYEESGLNSEPTDCEDNFCFPGIGGTTHPRQHVHGHQHGLRWPDVSDRCGPTATPPCIRRHGSSAAR